MEPLLGMTSTTYYYGWSEPSDDEDEHHIDRVVVDREDEDDDKHVLKLEELRWYSISIHECSIPFYELDRLLDVVTCYYMLWKI
jgi:hypothetical protein